MSVNGRMEKDVCYKHMLESHLAVRKGEILLFVIMCTDLKGIMLSERNQRRIDIV